MLKPSVSETRRNILQWLKDPALAHAGATADTVATHFGLPLPAAATHLRLLTSLGLLRARTAGDQVCYQRDEVRIAEVARMFEKGWQGAEAPAVPRLAHPAP
ncbi:helix-turn-helix domain-containing protein [Streptomyces sp. NPDC052682]|uniref:helix-turn-helix domain-containing protein n=1 Tax=Streptomyces sp. NPDC052682 TaxID=3154954 RepID=UPI003420342D